MPTTPLWVPLVVAGMGIAGVVVASLLAQIMSGRREDQRWLREQGAEKIRWARERQERREQWRREDQARWLQERQEIYARLAVALNAWTATIDEGRVVAAQSRLKRWSPEMEATADRLHDAFEQAFEQLKLVGSSTVIEAVRQIATSYLGMHHGLVHGEPGPLSVADRSSRAERVYTEMRNDLLVGKGDTVRG